MSNVENCSKLERRERIAEVLNGSEFKGMRRRRRTQSWKTAKKSGRTVRRATGRALWW